MDVKEEFHRQLNVLKATFYAFCKVGETGKVVPTLLSSHKPRFASFFFKMTMGHNYEPILHEENDSNPLTKL
jgi:hypothetical protein